MTNINLEEFEDGGSFFEEEQLNSTGKQTTENDDVKYGNPTIIEFKNTSNEIQKCVMFGYNEFKDKKNWGNHLGVDIRNLATNTQTYTTMMDSLYSSKGQTISKWKFMSDNKQNVQQPINFVAKHGDYTQSKPLPLHVLSCEKDQDLFVVESKRTFNVHVAEKIEFSLLPNTKMEIVFFTAIKNESNLGGNKSNPIKKTDETLLKYADPYAIKISNKSDEVLPCNIFGYNKLSGLPNNGNNESIEIINVMTGGKTGYSQLMTQSKHMPMLFGKIIYQSINIKNVMQDIGFFKSTDGFPIFDKTIARSCINYKQQQDEHIATIENIDGDLPVDADTMLSLIMQPNSELLITMFPTIQAKSKEVLVDNETNPRLSPITVIHTSPETEKTLDNTSIEDAKKKISDIKVFGNGDLFQLIAKASSESQGWMKSTKAMQCGNDVVIQVTTQQKNPDGSYAVAEALTTVNMALIDVDENGNKCVVARYPSEPYVAPKSDQ